MSQQERFYLTHRCTEAGQLMLDRYQNEFTPLAFNRTAANADSMERCSFPFLAGHWDIAAERFINLDSIEERDNLVRRLVEGAVLGRRIENGTFKEAAGEPSPGFAKDRDEPIVIDPARLRNMIWNMRVLEDVLNADDMNTMRCMVTGTDETEEDMAGDRRCFDISPSRVEALLDDPAGDLTGLFRLMVENAPAMINNKGCYLFTREFLKYVFLTPYLRVPDNEGAILGVIANGRPYAFNGSLQALGPAGVIEKIDRNNGMAYPDIPGRYDDEGLEEMRARPVSHIVWSLLHTEDALEQAIDELCSLIEEAEARALPDAHEALEEMIANIPRLKSENGRPTAPFETNYAFARFAAVVEALEDAKELLSAKERRSILDPALNDAVDQATWSVIKLDFQRQACAILLAHAKRDPARASEVAALPDAFRDLIELNCYRAENTDDPDDPYFTFPGRFYLSVDMTHFIHRVDNAPASTGVRDCAATALDAIAQRRRDAAELAHMGPDIAALHNSGTEPLPGHAPKAAISHLLGANVTDGHGPRSRPGQPRGSAPGPG